MPTATINVRFRWKIGKHLLPVSISPFDPKLTLPSFCRPRPAAPSEALVDVRELLAVHLDFTDNIDVRSIGLDHEKFAHNWWLKDNVGDVEIVGNHHQI